MSELKKELRKLSGLDKTAEELDAIYLNFSQHLEEQCKKCASAVEYKIPLEVFNLSKSFKLTIEETREMLEKFALENELKIISDQDKNRYEISWY